MSGVTSTKGWSSHQTEYMTYGILNLDKIPLHKLVKFHRWKITILLKPGKIEAQFQETIRASLIQAFQEKKLSSYYLIKAAAKDVKIPKEIIEQAMKQFSDESNNATAGQKKLHDQIKKTLLAVKRHKHLQVEATNLFNPMISIKAIGGDYQLNKVMWATDSNYLNKLFWEDKDKQKELPLTIKQLGFLNTFFSTRSIDLSFTLDELLEILEKVQCFDSPLLNKGLIDAILLHTDAKQNKNSLLKAALKQKNPKFIDEIISWLFSKERQNIVIKRDQKNCQISITINFWQIRKTTSFLKDFCENINSIAFKSEKVAQNFLTLKEVSFPMVKTVPNILLREPRNSKTLKTFFPNAANTLDNNNNDLDGPSKKRKKSSSEDYFKS